MYDQIFVQVCNFGRAIAINKCSELPSHFSKLLSLDLYDQNTPDAPIPVTVIQPDDSTITLYTDAPLARLQTSPDTAPGGAVGGRIRAIVTQPGTYILTQDAIQ